MFDKPIQLDQVDGQFQSSNQSLDAEAVDKLVVMIRKMEKDVEELLKNYNET
ncbi:hypothetical protein HR060_16350 [Catenovulum sp. SM1970]|uniref:hypothetical protein n=1 Tax=Marinifaba aquimaris TaxID=2741323 RepID=UPI001574E25E|nr:hypothetical protein [Marinifaba aquimaris]NTS78421.1 hypothetical protein [Marinifaba aquimaris]